MFVKNSCVQCTYTPYIEALLLWPGDIKSDGRNLLSMFASLDLNQPWPRGGLSFSLSQRMRGLYQSTERMIYVVYDNISMLFAFKTMHNSTIKFKCILQVHLKQTILNTSNHVSLKKKTQCEIVPEENL